VLGLTHLALKTDLSHRQRDYLLKIEGSARTLLGIINDILDFSKIEADKLHIDSVPFDLDSTLNHLASAIGLLAEEKGLEIVFDVPPDVPRQLVGDPLRLHQVLLNLCANAVKFTATGGASPTRSSLLYRGVRAWGARKYDVTC
jgi:two-component system sensor histidine kinase/response regulator